MSGKETSVWKTHVAVSLIRGNLGGSHCVPYFILFRAAPRMSIKAVRSPNPVKRNNRIDLAGSSLEITPYAHVFVGQFLTSSIRQLHALPHTFNLVLYLVTGLNIHQQCGSRLIDCCDCSSACRCVCFIQCNINNELFWTRFYRSDDRILVGPKTDPPRRALTVRNKMCAFWKCPECQSKNAMSGSGNSCKFTVNC